MPRRKNINTASKSHLTTQQIPGKLADAILTTRESKGRFKHMSELNDLYEGDFIGYKNSMEQELAVFLNINTASKKELTGLQIPGDVADEILSRRKKEGLFHNMEELQTFMQSYDGYKEVWLAELEVVLDINNATKEGLIRLGISGTVAEKIVNHVEKYGPIENMDELKEKSGVDDDNLKVLKERCEAKPNINTATLQQLQDVGIGIMLAIMIVDFRERKGFFVMENDLDENVFKEDEREMIWTKCEIGKFNLHDAKKKNFRSLGIGEIIATAIEKILQDDRRHISNIDELSAVKGIGTIKLNKLKTHCYIAPKENDKPDSATQTVTRSQFITYKLLRLSDGLNLIHLNINRLTKWKKDELGKLISDCDKLLDVVCLCETKQERDTRTHEIENYKFYFVSSQTSPSDSGGVGMFVKSIQTDQHRRKDLEFQIGDCENMWMEIEKHGRKIVVGTVYRHPVDNYVEFAASLADVINKVKQECGYYVIVGDININLFDAHKHRFYIKMLDHLGCRSIIKEVTRRVSGTLIDHIYTNIPSEYIKVAGIIKTSISDHYTTYCSVDMANLPQEPAKMGPCIQMQNLSL